MMLLCATEQLGERSVVVAHLPTTQRGLAKKFVATGHAGCSRFGTLNLLVWAKQEVDTKLITGRGNPFSRTAPASTSNKAVAMPSQVPKRCSTAPGR